MKAKLKSLLAVFALVVSISIIGFGFTQSTVVSASEEVSETETPIIVETDNGEVLDALDKLSMESVIAWVGTIINLVISTGIIAKVSMQKKQTVAVAVNDSDTQEKLDILAAENANLKDMIMAAVQLQKGTQEVINALFAENPSIDNKVKEVINKITLNSEAIIQDVNEVAGAETKKKMTETLKTIGNIILG